jgi:site-specific recombinase XerD
MALFNQKGDTMTNTLPATANPTGLSIAPTDTQAIYAHATHFHKEGKSEATRKAIKSDIKQFTEWLSLQNDQTATYPNLIKFLTYSRITGKKYATIQRRKIYILKHFSMALSPADIDNLNQFMNGIRNGTKEDKEKGIPAYPATPKKQAHALTVAELKRLLSQLDKTKNGLRNRAMLSIGFSCALRVSELCALRVGDIKRLDASRGEVFIANSKTDQSGQGYTIAIEQGDHVQPLDDIARHIKKSGLKEGDNLFDIKPLRFWRIIKELANKAGIEGVSCHSLRAGFITCAVGAGATIDKVKAISRHKSTDILLSYVREADKFKNNATKKVL